MTAINQSPVVRHIEPIPYFAYADLSDKAKGSAFDKWHESFEFFSDFIIEDITAILENIGFYNVKIWYSLGYCQSDFASFDARYSFEKGSLKKLKANYPNATEWHTVAKQLQQLQRKNFYSLSGEFTDSDFDVESKNDRYWSYDQDNRDLLKPIIKEINRIIYNSIRDEYEYQTSQESFEQWVNDFGIWFTIDGKCFVEGV